MRKKMIVMFCAVAVLLVACGSSKSSGGCSCCQCAEQTGARVEIEDANEVLGLMPESSSVSESSTVEIIEENTAETIAVETETATQTQPDLSQPITETQIEVPATLELTEGEKEARKELMAQLAVQREALYALPNSIEKTNQIAQIDQMIIENNAYDFSDTAINFIGDSITEGIGGDKAEDGSYISYVNYVQNYLNVGEVLNRGKAGRMFSDYGNEEYSFSLGLNHILYTTSDVTVVFLGVNDYLSEGTDKRFGEQNSDSYSTAGYCGALRQVLNYFDAYMGEQEIFFVITNNVEREVNATYSDLSYQPTQGDFMGILKSYVEDRGYHIIDLYNTGFMDLADSATKDAYTADGLHPNNSGNIVLAQHIAAEIALAMSNK